MSKLALVIGASRGIGRQIAITLSRNGYAVGVAAKTTDQSEKLPGTIYSVAEEIAAEGGQALPLHCDVRDQAQVTSAVSSCIHQFGQLDLAIYNAGAILWKKVEDTPLKRWDLMMQVNSRGAYAMVHSVLPHLLERKSGHIILVAPPIYNRFFKGKTPYAMSKVGMTVLVHGLANELKDTGVSISALWPATTIESHVTTVRNVPAGYMRKSTVFADACLNIASQPAHKYNGRALVDEEVLREGGVEDFREYRCDPQVEPPRILPKQFPSLLVEEENDVPVFPDSKL